MTKHTMKLRARALKVFDKAIFPTSADLDEKHPGQHAEGTVMSSHEQRAHFIRPGDGGGANSEDQCPPTSIVAVVK